MKKGIIVAVVVVAALAFGAMVLGSSKNDATMSASSSGEKASSMVVSTNAVEIKDYAYSPAIIKVKVGTTVTWTNKDVVEHTVSIKDGAEGPDSELLGKAETYSYTFTRAGTFDYYCKPHPNMLGSVIVE